MEKARVASDLANIVRVRGKMLGGITVVSAQVSTVLRVAGLRRGRTVTASGQQQPAKLNPLVQVKHVADQVGGIEKLRAVFRPLERLL